MRVILLLLFVCITALSAPQMAAAQHWACKGKTGCEAPGSACPDGTIFAGCPAPGYQAMYTTRCDGGRFWNGTDCTGAAPWLTISQNDEHSCGIKQDGTLWCWGENEGGQLGDNSTTDRSVPTQVNGGGQWKQVAVGGIFTCGIRSDDTIRCWGDTYNGAIGDGTTSQRLVPTALNSTGGWNTTAWKSVSAGTDTACAIRLSDDALFCWGSNDTGGGGMFGNNSTTNASSPTAAGGGGAWKQVAVGSSHVCGIRSDDTVRCWGGNYFGQLGDNTNTNSIVPVTLNGGGTWKLISVGGDSGNSNTCGIKTDNTAWCWGLNNDGQLGNGTTGVDSDIPVAVSGGFTWTSLDVGGWTVCGIRTDGTLRCWGENATGQIGDNSTTDRNTPTAVGSATWKIVATGGYDTDFNGSVEGSACGITTDDVAFCWGFNASGQVGDNSTTQRNLPTAVNGAPGARITVPFNNGNATGGTDVVGASSLENGIPNTAALVVADSDSGVGGTQPHQAAAYCDGLTIHGYSDWYLPAAYEAFLLRLTLPNDFDIYGASYWASTNGAPGYAWHAVGGHLMYYSDDKDTSLYVRCTRRQ